MPAVRQLPDLQWLLLKRGLNSWIMHACHSHPYKQTRVLKAEERECQLHIEVRYSGRLCSSFHQKFHQFPQENRPSRIFELCTDGCIYYMSQCIHIKHGLSGCLRHQASHSRTNMLTLQIQTVTPSSGIVFA